MRRTEWFIDDFQQKLSLPVAMRVAAFCRNPKPHPETHKLAPPPFATLEQFATTSREKRIEENKLLVVLGPFGVRHDNSYTYWQALKIIVGDETVAAVLARINSSKGNGGYYNVKLWDIYEQAYTYYGDPEQERQIHPEGIVHILCDHMAAQYHVGSVERDEYAAQNETIINSSKDLIYGDAEQRKRSSYETAAKDLFGD